MRTNEPVPGHIGVTEKHARVPYSWSQFDTSKLVRTYCLLNGQDKRSSMNESL